VVVNCLGQFGVFHNQFVGGHAELVEMLDPLVLDVALSVLGDEDRAMVLV
jgi:hypothetical protein